MIVHTLFAAFLIAIGGWRGHVTLANVVVGAEDEANMTIFKNIGGIDDQATSSGMTVGAWIDHVTRARVNGIDHFWDRVTTFLGGLEEDVTVSTSFIGGLEDDHVTLKDMNTAAVGDHVTKASVTAFGALWDHVTSVSDGLQDYVTNANVTKMSAGGTSVQAATSDVILSEEDYLRITKAIVIFSTPLGFIGLLTNSITIAVFLRMPRSVTSTYFLLATFIDLGFLIVTLFTLLMSLAFGYNVANRCVYLYKVCTLYANMFTGASLRRVAHCVTMLISLDRCFLIAFPFKARNLQHIRRPRLYVAVCFVFVFAMRVPWLFFFQVVRYPRPPAGCEGVDAGYMMPTPMYTDTRENGPGILFRYAFTVLFTYIPVLTMGFSTIYMIVKLARIKSPKETSVVDQTNSHPNPSGQGNTGNRRSESTARPTQSQFFKLQRQNSITVLIYAGFYVFLALPDAVQTILSTFLPGYSPRGKEYYLVLTVAAVYNILDVISSTMTFFVYVITGTAFRAQFLALIFCESKRVRSRASSSVTSEVTVD